MYPDETDEERQEKLPEDIERPFTPADTGESAKDDDTLPTTDTDVEINELYQEGVDNPDASADTAVADYDPENDQRK